MVAFFGWLTIVKQKVFQKVKSILNNKTPTPCLVELLTNSDS